MNEYKQTIYAVKKALPAVVGILVLKDLDQLEKELGPEVFKEGSLFLKYLQQPGAIDESNRVKITGCSGFFISSDGYILTNRHAVKDEKAIYRVLWQGQVLETKVVAADYLTDVAVLKTEVKNSPYLLLGDSDKLELGQTVLAIGNALGEFENTVSRGIISGLSRKVRAGEGEKSMTEEYEFRGMIQTDAAINPGNSGGPLIDLYGRAIGINAVTILEVENIGFAIPINLAKTIFAEIKKYGRVCQKMLGVRYILINEEVQKAHHLPVSYGAYLVYGSDYSGPGIFKNSLAEKLGFKEGDIILKINNEPIGPEKTITQILQKQKIGDEVVFHLWRQGKELEIKTRWQCF